MFLSNINVKKERKNKNGKINVNLTILL
jgi:hypothetical protein